MRSPWGLAAIMTGYALLLLAGLAQVLDPPPLVMIAAAVLVLLTLAVAVAWAAPAAGVEWRARAVARCCDRPPLARDAVTLPARTSTEPTQEEPL